MKLINQIVSDPEEHKYGSNQISELASSPYPIYLYGAGSMATDYLQLQKYGVSIAGVLVDEKYHKQGQKLGALDVKTIQSMIGGEKLNIIVAFDESLDVIERKIPASLPINKIYHVDIGPLYDKDHLTAQYVNDHLNELQRVYNLCSDQLSKDALCGFINTKITGNTKYLAKIRTCDIYFPDDIIKLSDDEIFVDCGAYTGDSSLEFINKVNRKYRKIYAFEPDVRNLKILNETINSFKIRDMVIIPKGVWNKEESLKFKVHRNGSHMNSFVETGFVSEDIDICSLDVTSLDEVIDTNEMVSYIKMDIEGSELKALEGAKHIIQRHRPRLAISAYHLKDDIYKIPLYLKSLNPDYKIYFRQHHYISTDLVCYAIP